MYYCIANKFQFCSAAQKDMMSFLYPGKYKGLS